MLAEAMEIIRDLHGGDLVTYRGDYFDTDAARIWDLPDEPVRIGLAVAGDRAVTELAPLADDLIAVEPKEELIETWNLTADAPTIREGGARAIGQIPICWDPDEKTAIERAHEQFRWYGGGWNVNADLPTTAGFASASQFVTLDDVAESIACGPDLDKIVESVSAFWTAGFTDIALVQVGDEGQQEFLDEAAGPLLEKLRAAAP